MIITDVRYNITVARDITPYPSLALAFGAVTAVAIIANLVLLIYILVHKLYKNFISSQFIAHLCLTNIICSILLIPIFLITLFTGEQQLTTLPLMCRIQALLTCAIWTVMALMSLCIAGVHLLTFARIHYEQLFGLPPNMLCILSWIISMALALPAITNDQIVTFDPDVRQCMWMSTTSSGKKFLAYLIILGIGIPAIFMYYAYIRVLGILYHSPIVFQSIGLYKSRFLVYGFLMMPFYQLPFYLTNIFDVARKDADWSGEDDPLVPIMFMFLAYTSVLVSPFLYGASIFMIKEEDMALNARAHKQGGSVTGPAYHPANHPLQAQLI